MAVLSRLSCFGYPVLHCIPVYAHLPLFNVPIVGNGPSIHPHLHELHAPMVIQWFSDKYLFPILLCRSCEMYLKFCNLHVWEHRYSDWLGWGRGRGQGVSWASTMGDQSCAKIVGAQGQAGTVLACAGPVWYSWRRRCLHH
jgi:hypothetical protein